MFVKEDMDFRDLEANCWGQATKVLKEISDADKEDALMSYLEDIFYDDIPTLTEVNDILAFDWEQLYKDLGIVQWDELEDLLDMKAVEKVADEVKEALDNLEVDDPDREDYEQVLEALIHLEGEVKSSVKDEEITEDLDSIVDTLIGRRSWMIDNKNFESMIGQISDWIDENK